MQCQVSDLARLTELSPQCMRDLPDMRHLFHRRANESGQTFPLRLTNDSKSATIISRGIHNRILRKRPANFGQLMIQGEVMANGGCGIDGASMIFPPSASSERSSRA